MPPLRPVHPFKRLLGLAVLLWWTSAAVGQTDGSRKWTYGTVSSFLTGNILSSPSIAPDGTIYIGVEIGTSALSSGQLLALTPAGARKWVYTLPDWVDSAPGIGSDGTIYFGCWDGYLYALAPDRTLKWRCSLGSYASASPAIGPDGTIYIGTGSGNVYAVTPEGAVKWFFPTLDWIEGAPAIAPDGTIYIGSDDNAVYALRPDGTEKWHYTTGNDVASSPAIGPDGTVYIGSRDLKCYALNPDGSIKWTYPTADMIDASPAVAADGTVYFATTGGRLLAFHPEGTLKWQYPAAGQTALGSIYSTPALRSDGTIVFGSSDNAIHAVKADGTLKWKTSVGDWVDSSPVIAPDGTIYVGCTDKNVYALNGIAPPSMAAWPQFQRDAQRTGVQYVGAVPGTTGQLSNLSVRSNAGANENTLIVGFAINGSGTRNLLLRGVGPTLASYDVAGALADPLIRVFPPGASTPTATNDNWSDANGDAIAATGAALGAFPLANGSLDAALLSSYPAGTQTVHVVDKNGATGIALLEVWDAGGSANARLANVSARTRAGTGGSILIAGFVVAGGTRTLLIRGVGPTLGRYGVADVLMNPQLKIYNAARTLIAENDDWAVAANAPAIAAAGPGVYAFPLDDGSKDAGLLVTLPPGSYTAQISGVNDTTGVGLVEVYEVP